MKKLLIATFILGTSSCPSTISASQQSIAEGQKNLTAQQLSKQIYDALYPFVSMNTPMFSVDNEI